MKSNEFVDEGMLGNIWNAIKSAPARSGFLGSTNQALAYAKADQQLAYQKFLQGFLIGLKQVLDAERKSASGLTESMSDYQKFNNLLESIILTEATAKTIEQVVKDYMVSQIQKEKVSMTPDQITDLDADITKFANEYRTALAKKVNIPGYFNRLAKPLADRHWTIVMSAAKTQQDADDGATSLDDDAPPDQAAWEKYRDTNNSSHGGTIPSGPMKGNPITDNPTLQIGGTRKFEFDFTRKSWVDMTSGIASAEMKHADSIKKLNIQYHAAYDNLTI